MNEPGSGVYPDYMLDRSISDEHIDAGSYRIKQAQVQPASLDLTLGKVAHRLRCSFLPDRLPVEEKLAQLSEGEIDLRQEGPGFLERNVPYLIELRETLALPGNVRAKANPKSSTGRLDVFTRVITDKSGTFDEIAPGYHGKLYLEVVPISFPIRVHEGLSLNQLRLMQGTDVLLQDDAIRDLHEDANGGLVFDKAGAKKMKSPRISNGLFLSLDLEGDDDGIVGFKARRNTRLLDLRGQRADPREFWEPVYKERGNKIVLEPEDFYLLLSNEAVRIPPSHASEMIAYDPTSGELRTHYAGFFDPGFGDFSTTRRRGSRAALEVRAHDVAFQIEHGQPVCKLSFERMCGTPKTLYGRERLSNYQGQTSTLSKYFLPWNTTQDALPL